MLTTPPSPTVNDETDFKKSPYNNFPYSNGSKAASKLYVALRPPASNSSQSTPISELPAIVPQAHLSGHKWHLAHSSRTLWTSRRNVQLLFKFSQQSTPSSESTNWELCWSWQEIASDEVKTLTIYPRENAIDDWELLGTGKEGSLESWMIETEYGIEDNAGQWITPSGEIRADWRPRWLVLYFPTTSLSPAGIDIFSDRVRQDPSSSRMYVTYDETIRQIRVELLKMGNSELEKLAGEIIESRNDGNRNEEGSSPKVSMERIWRAEDEPQEIPGGFCGLCIVQ